METTLLDLIGVDTRLQRVSRTHGGEFCGSCPFCGGKDRFRCWPFDDRPRYWCRGCNQHGDAIQYLRDKKGLSYQQALQELDLQDTHTSSLPSVYKTYNTHPSLKWQETGRALCHGAQACLWSRRGAAGLAYLRSRGLTEASIREAMLGFSPGLVMAGETWGIQTKQVVIPRGIVIPWYCGSELWKITLRLGKNADHRYEQVLGSQECLYNADTISSESTIVLYEGVFDALSGQQLVPEFAHVATDDVQKCRSARWIVKLCLASRVLIAYDADEAGDRESAFWTRTLSHAVRWRPWAKDVNAMLVEGQNILEWLVLGLA